MRRTLLISATTIMLAVLAAVVSEGAIASKPLGHVHGQFTAERMGLASVGGPLIQFGSVTIRVNAFDHTLDPPPCSSCPGPDTGTITETWGENPFGIEFERTYQVTDVEVTGNSARIFTSDGVIFQFHDGGSPGKRVVGPPNVVGLLPTLDWYEQRFFFSPRQHITGFVASGNIHVDTLPT